MIMSINPMIINPFYFKRKILAHIERRKKKLLAIYLYEHVMEANKFYTIFRSTSFLFIPLLCHSNDISIH